MDPVASGLTILSTIRKGLSIAKKLYEAPRELEELQVEVETFVIILNDVVINSYDLCTTNSGFGVAIGATRACLLKIQQIIEYELVKEVPEGKKARRRAWLGKANEVHELLEKLADCRANVILALDGEIRRQTTVAAKRSESLLEQLHSTMVHKSEGIERSLLEFGIESRYHSQLLTDRIERYEQRWESFMAQVAAQHYQQRQLEARFSTLLGGPQPNRHGLYALEYASDGVKQQQLSAADCFRHSDNQSSTYQMTTAQLCEIPSVSDFPTEQVLSLLSSCSTTHSFCGGQRGDAPMLPTRVLDVGSDDTDVRLHHSQGLRAKYVALSYCWGGALCIGTTQSTLDKWTSCIPWGIIPGLFQDAILVTRKLGIKYIWIDALCMVWDDPEDCERESGMMATVFGNATCIIAADSTPNPSSRLLPSATIVPDAQSPSTTGDDPQDRQDAGVTYDKIMGLLAKYEWRQRCWVLQETLLAPAVIHCAGDTAVFECNHGISPLLRDARAGQLTLPHADDYLKRMCATWLTQPAQPVDLLDLWWRVVEQYSGKKLAFYRDKLVALSGIARKFEAALGSYVAGLWSKHDFVRSLCWRPRHTSDDPPTYAAPSWSWASVDGAVIAPPSKGMRSVATMIEVVVTPVGQNNLGALQSAALTLKAYSIDLECKGQDDYVDRCNRHQCLVYAVKGIVSLTFEADNFQSFRYGMLFKCLKVLEDEQGNFICILVAPAGDDSWRRIALVELHRRRGEHRLFGSAVEGVFKIV